MLANIGNELFGELTAGVELSEAPYNAGPHVLPAEEELSGVPSDLSLVLMRTCSTISSSVLARLDQHSRAAAMEKLGSTMHWGRWWGKDRRFKGEGELGRIIESWKAMGCLWVIQHPWDVGLISFVILGLLFPHRSLATIAEQDYKTEDFEATLYDR
nr:hypothetical protein Iba_chr12fCG17750 [Ipomoea batatas]